MVSRAAIVCSIALIAGTFVGATAARREAPADHASAALDVGPADAGVLEIRPAEPGPMQPPPIGPGAAVAPVPPAPIPPFGGAGPTVAVIGDSITLMSVEDVRSRLSAAGFSSSIIGLYGSTTAGAMSYVRAYAEVRPAIVIIELGTNDVSEIVRSTGAETLASYQQRMHAIAAMFPDSCVAVTTVAADRSVADSTVDVEAWNRTARAINDWLRATFSNVVGWDQVVHVNKAWGTPLLLEDDVHPNHGGVRALADLDRQAAERCLAQKGVAVDGSSMSTLAGGDNEG